MTAKVEYQISADERKALDAWLKGKRGGPEAMNKALDETSRKGRRAGQAMKKSLGSEALSQIKSTIGGLLSMGAAVGRALDGTLPSFSNATTDRPSALVEGYGGTPVYT